MKSLLFANMKTNLKYFLRQRVLQVLGVLLFLVLLGTLWLILALTGKNTNTTMIFFLFGRLNAFIYYMTGLMMLFYLHSHLTQRNLKLVFTKPCPREVWMGSTFLTPALLALAGYLMVVCACLSMMVLGDMPFQWGFVYIFFFQFGKTLILLSLLFFLSLIMHPILAVLTVLFFNEGIFYWILLGLMKLDQVMKGGWFIKTLEGLATGIYKILPLSIPFKAEAAQISQTMHVSGDAWMLLLTYGGYVFALTGFFMCCSVIIFRKKQLI